MRGASGPETEVVPLYGRLSAAEQHRVFETKRAPGIRRRVVLATNVAETSLTVPGIKYVVDAGTARISRYSARAKVQRLPIEAISQASANQRSGRAGRTSDGIAIRLYSEEDFARPHRVHRPRDPAHQPGRGHPADDLDRARRHRGVPVPAAAGLARHPGRRRPAARAGRDLDRPDDEAHPHHADRPRPRAAAARPALRPHAGRGEEARRGARGRGDRRGAEHPGCARAPAREAPAGRHAHARFADPTSDFLSFLALWNHLEEKQRELSCSAFRRLCKSEFLNYLRVREWQDLYRQLLRAGSLKAGAPKVDPDGIHRSLLAGLLSRIGLRDERVKATAAASPTSARSASTSAPATRGSRSSPARRSRRRRRRP